MKFYLKLGCLFVMLANTLQAQEKNFGITVFPENPTMVCAECEQTFASIPRGVQFSIEKDDFLKDTYCENCSK